MFIYNGKISIEKLLLARCKLKEFLSADKSTMSITASIKAFEYTYELAWKALRKVLIDVYGNRSFAESPRPTFHKAFENNLIKDLNFWMSCIEKRNETSHCYEDEMSEDVYNFLPDFLIELNKVIEILKMDKI